MGWFGAWSRGKGPRHLVAGVWGEQVAERSLKEKGCKIIGRRVRVGARDEIDLLVRDGQVLVFVEVKTRRNEAFGRPVDAVDQAKRRHLSRAAIRYLTRLKPGERPDYFRFDVVEVIGEPGAAAPEVRHLENVFTLGSGYRLPW